MNELNGRIIVVCAKRASSGRELVGKWNLRWREIMPQFHMIKYEVNPAKVNLEEVKLLIIAITVTEVLI